MVETSETLIKGWRGPLQWLVLAGLAVLLVIGGLWYRHDRAQSGAPGGGDVLVVGDQRGGIQALLKAAGELDHGRTLVISTARIDISARQKLEIR